MFVFELLTADLNDSDAVTVVVVVLDEASTTEDNFKKVWLALIETLGDSCALRVYYRVDSDSGCWSRMERIVPETVSVTLVPVWKLECGLAAVVCGMRY